MNPKFSTFSAFPDLKAQIEDTRVEKKLFLTDPKTYIAQAHQKFGVLAAATLTDLQNNLFPQCQVITVTTEREGIDYLEYQLIDGNHTGEMIDVAGTSIDSLRIQLLFNENNLLRGFYCCLLINGEVTDEMSCNLSFENLYEAVEELFLEDIFSEPIP